MDTQGIISAFQGVLAGFSFDEPVDFPEEFAQKRFLKKMERPDPSKDKRLREACFARWLSNDAGLPKIVLPPLEWYKARILLHSWIRDYWPKAVSIDFPKGSEFVGTKGFNSIEARLSVSTWTCTRDNFEAFASLCFRHKALKRAAKRRYTKWYNGKDFDMTLKESDSYLYRRFRRFGRDVGFHVFSWKLSRVVQFVHGSRFSTVPKNNEKRRPINVEPFCNILTQRIVGNKFRSMLKCIGQDLDTLADEHGRRVSQPYATIDLSDASDSISVELVRFMLPSWLYEELQLCRSQMTLGSDGCYYITKKISSMGCGFTFELMTALLTALCRALDPSASVFGDDIIVSNDVAHRVMECLSAVGLKVNEDKSFVNSAFRESCGSNFHDDFGYLKSYDFWYPENIHDCVVCYNKAKALSFRFSSFKKLERTLHGFIPRALRGGPFREEGIRTGWSPTESEQVDCYFMTGDFERPLGRKFGQIENNIASTLCYDHSVVAAFNGFHYSPDLRSKSLKHLSRSRWAKYEMYLHAGRVSKDVVSGCGCWAVVKFIRIEQWASRLKAFDV